MSSINRCLFGVIQYKNTQWVSNSFYPPANCKSMITWQAIWILKKCRWGKKLIFSIELKCLKPYNCVWIEFVMVFFMFFVMVFFMFLFLFNGICGFEENEFLKILRRIVIWFCLFNGMLDPIGLFNVDLWLICKCLIIIITNYVLKFPSPLFLILFFMITIIYLNTFI